MIKINLLMPILAAGGNFASVFTVLAVIVFVIGAIWYSVWLYEKKRTERIESVAHELGLPFFAKGDDSLLDSLNHLRLFSQGHSKKIQNMLHGKANDVELAIFDYRYTIGGGKNSQTHKQSVVYVRSAALDLPHFAVRPEGLFHKIGSVFGYQDIDFESHPKFSSRYLLRGENEPAIRDVFTNERLSFFEEKEKICVEARGDQLVYYRQRKRVKPYEVEQLMHEGFGLFALFRGTVEA